MKKLFENILLFLAIKKKQEYKPKIAVLIIDMQARFVDDLRQGEKERIISNQIEIIQECKQNNIPMIVLEMMPEKYGTTITELISELESKGEKPKTMWKEYDSGFNKTNLHMYLQSIGVNRVLLMGVYADYCVKKTAENAISLGYQVITSNDLISGGTSDSYSNNRSWYTKNGLFLRISDLQKHLEK